MVGSLDYPRMLTATKAYKVALNVNSVVGSPSMCARRIFEATAAGTPVVSTPSPAITQFFPADEVVTVATPEEAELSLRALVNSPELRDRMVHTAQRRIWREHTYGHRVDEVLSAVGLTGHAVPRPTVSALVSTNRPHQVEHVLRQLGAQEGVDLQVLLLTHGFEPGGDVTALARDLGVADLVTLQAPAQDTLGECLNRLVDAADGDVVAKIDDDDLYGRHYLLDQLHALDYSRRAGRGQAGPPHVPGVPRRDHRAVPGAGAPLHRPRDGTDDGAPREVARAHPFAAVSRGEDTGFLRDVVAGGAGSTRPTASTSSRCGILRGCTPGRPRRWRCSPTPGSWVSGSWRATS